MMAELPPADLGPAPIASPVAKATAKPIRVRLVFALLLVAAVAVARPRQVSDVRSHEPSTARRGPIQTMISPPVRPSSTPAPTTPAPPQPPAATPAPASPASPPAADKSTTPAVEKQASPTSPSPETSKDFVDPAFSNEPAQTNTAAEAAAAKKRELRNPQSEQADEAARLQGREGQGGSRETESSGRPERWRRLIAKSHRRHSGCAGRPELGRRKKTDRQRGRIAAQTPEDNDQVDRLQTMQENLTQFWDGIHESMGKLQAAEEIVVKDTRIVVIESTRDLLAVKALGRVHHFRHCRTCQRRS